MKVWFVSLVAVLSFGFAQHNMGTMTMSNEGLSSLEGDAFEIAFISGMIVHHEGAVEMAQCNGF